MGPNASTTISACVHKRHSEQSRAGVTDECFRVAAVGLEHLERLVPGDIRDLDQVRPALHRARHEARAQAVAAEGRRIEAKAVRRHGGNTEWRPAGGTASTRADRQNPRPPGRRTVTQPWPAERSIPGNGTRTRKSENRFCRLPAWPSPSKPWRSSRQARGWW